MTEVEIAKKIKEAAETMAIAIKNGFDVAVRSSKDGITIYKDKRTKLT